MEQWVECGMEKEGNFMVKKRKGGDFRGLDERKREMRCCYVKRVQWWWREKGKVRKKKCVFLFVWVQVSGFGFLFLFKEFKNWEEREKMGNLVLCLLGIMALHAFASLYNTKPTLIQKREREWRKWFCLALLCFLSVSMCINFVCEG